jgi:hypothetical protein
VSVTNSVDPTHGTFALSGSKHFWPWHNEWGETVVLFRPMRGSIVVTISILSFMASRALEPFRQNPTTIALQTQHFNPARKPSAWTRNSSNREFDYCCKDEINRDGCLNSVHFHSFRYINQCHKFVIDTKRDDGLQLSLRYWRHVRTTSGMCDQNAT